MNDILIDLKTENNFAFGKLYQNNFHRISIFVQNNNVLLKMPRTSFKMLRWYL